MRNERSLGEDRYCEGKPKTQHIRTGKAESEMEVGGSAGYGGYMEG